MKYRVAACALMGALALPLFTSAVTVEELRAQVTELLNRIDALQQNIGTPGVSSVPSTPAASGGACPQVSRSLRVGSEGDDVKRLQQFLALDPAIYPERLVTGYYGALTEAAVKRFQCKNKIVCEGTPESTGYGVTGPRTAAILALQCPAGGTPQAETGAVGGFMRVSPISGAAPLNVSIEATVNTTNSCATAVYEIDFGDNTAPGQITVPSGTCHELRQVFNHGYNAPGAYTISLRSGVHRTTATVTVSGSQVTQPTTVPDTFAATPTSGTAPFPVVFQGTINGAAKCNTGSYTLDFGNGQTATLPVSGCTPNSYTVTHTYTTAGNFVAKLRRNDGTEVGSVAVAATGSTGTQSGGGSYGGFFSVSPSTDGNFSTVTVQFDLETPCTPYDLDWGDASTHVTQSGGSCPGGVDDKQFSHTYSNAGSYTLILKRGTNLAEVDTAGITISN